MSLSLPRFVKRGLAGIGLAGLAVLGILYVQELAKIDPFEALRHPATGIDNQVGIRLESVSLRHYKGMDLVSQAMVDRVDVSKDRSRFDLVGVHDGVYRGEQATVQFASRTGEWNDVRRVLEVEPGTHIKSKDFDLDVSKFSYTKAKAQLHVPGEINGTLSKGQVKANNFIYNMNDRSMSAGPIAWKGKLALTQGSAQGESKIWNIIGQRFSQNKDIQTYVNAVAASDDTIIKAPMITRDVNTDIITATGDVSYYSAKADMTCDKAVIYESKKFADLTGHVRMLLKPKDQEQKVIAVDLPPFRPIVPDSVAKTRPTPPTTDSQKKYDEEIRSAQSIRKYPVLIFAERIQYWYKDKERHAVITGSPQARQELPEGRWRHIWTHHANYDAEAETLRLISDEGKSDTRVLNSKGDDLMMDWIEVSTKDDDDTIMDAENVHGSIFRDPENPPALPDRPAAGTKPPGTKTAPAKKGGGSGLSGPIGRGKSKLGVRR